MNYEPIEQKYQNQIIDNIDIIRIKLLLALPELEKRVYELEKARYISQDLLKTEINI